MNQHDTWINTACRLPNILRFLTVSNFQVFVTCCILPVTIIYKRCLQSTSRLHKHSTLILCSQRHLAAGFVSFPDIWKMSSFPRKMSILSNLENFKVICTISRNVCDIGANHTLKRLEIHLKMAEILWKYEKQSVDPRKRVWKSCNHVIQGKDGQIYWIKTQ